MTIHLFRIEYTPDNIRDYAVTILAENGDAAIKKISEIVKRQIVVRTIDTVCSGIQLATDKVVEIIAEPLLKKENVQADKVEKPKKTYKCPYCDFESTATLAVTSHKRHKHPEEWEKEKEKRSENS